MKCQVDLKAKEIELQAIKKEQKNEK